jgi:hypothetical protein
LIPLNLLNLLNILNLQVTLPKKRRRDKTSAQFGEALMSYLGRKADRSIIKYTTFQQSLRELAM